MELIDPISPSQQQLVVAETERYITIASEFYQQAFPAIPVLFDLKGRAAGMYKIHRGKRQFRFNPYLFAKYFQENLTSTVPHEVAHYVSDVLHGMRHIRPHGKEWQAIMTLYGVKPERTHQFDMRGIPQRQYRYFRYQCACQEYQLTSKRHNLVQAHQRRYFCRQCKNELNYLDNA